MVDYPISFEASSVKQKNREKWQIETGEGLEIEMDFPPEFGGTGSRPSPEDLFTASVQSCYLATFAKIAERKELDYSGIEVDAEIELDRGQDSRPVMKRGAIELKVIDAGDRQKAFEVAEAAEDNCFIHNSVITDLDLDISFE